MESPNANDKRLRGPTGDGSREGTVNSNAPNHSDNSDLADEIKGYADKLARHDFTQAEREVRGFSEAMGFDLGDLSYEGDRTVVYSIRENAAKRERWTPAMVDVFRGANRMATLRNQPRRRSPL